MAMFITAYTESKIFLGDVSASDEWCWLLYCYWKVTRFIFQYCWEPEIPLNLKGFDLAKLCAEGDKCIAAHLINVDMTVIIH
jgi:hypothetical protein